MKFRIVTYYDRYKAQVLKDDKYVNIGSPTGYYNIESAKEACETYKANFLSYVVEEFEL